GAGRRGAGVAGGHAAGCASAQHAGDVGGVSGGDAGGAAAVAGGGGSAVRRDHGRRGGGGSGVRAGHDSAGGGQLPGPRVDHEADGRRGGVSTGSQAQGGTVSAGGQAGADGRLGLTVTHRRYVPYSHAHYAGNLVDGAYAL